MGDCKDTALVKAGLASCEPDWSDFLQTVNGSPQNKTGENDPAAQTEPVAQPEPVAPANVSDEPLARVPVMDGVKTLLEKNFDNLDGNGNGRLEGWEIGNAAKSYTYNKRDHALLNILKGGLSIDIAKRSNDQWGPETEITKKDVEQFGKDIQDYVAMRQQQKATVPEAYAMANFGMARFNDLDANHDGTVSRAEIDERLEKSNPAERTQLESIRQNYDSILFPHGRPVFFRRRALYEMMLPREFKIDNFQDYLDQQFINSVNRTDGAKASWNAISTQVSRYSMLEYYDRINRDKLQ